MKSRYYHISEPILLLLFTSAPVSWWVALTSRGHSAPYPALAYIVAAILATCTASYTLTIRLYPGLGRGHNRGAERLAKTVLNLLIFILTLVAVGFLPGDNSVSRYVYVAIYAVSVGHMFFIHYLVSIRVPVVDPADAGVAELAEEHRASVEAFSFVGGPFALTAIVTYLTWLLFRYNNELPNHATLFGTLFAILITVASRFRSYHKRESDR